MPFRVEQFSTWEPLQALSTCMSLVAHASFLCLHRKSGTHVGALRRHQRADLFARYNARDVSTRVQVEHQDG